jgi:HEPN superfamily AbiU2-like protein
MNLTAGHLLPWGVQCHRATSCVGSPSAAGAGAPWEPPPHFFACYQFNDIELACPPVSPCLRRASHLEVTMDKNQAEETFEAYRQHLHYEMVCLASYLRLYRHLYERRRDRLEEMNLAPAFFGVVLDALLTAIILGVDKLFDKKGKRGLWNFLTFCENNRKIFAIQELQRRKNYPEGHWMLKERRPVTFERIQEDKRRIEELPSLQSFRLRRDKFSAHLDKAYFGNRAQLAEDAPLLWLDFTDISTTMQEILNAYSSDYDGMLYTVEPVNITDVDQLLDRLHTAARGGTPRRRA